MTITKLHIMTGTVGKLVTKLVKSFPIKEDGDNFINAFMKANNISWCVYQPRPRSLRNPTEAWASQAHGPVPGFEDWPGCMAMESVHHDLKLEWERSKVGPNHSEYADLLFDTIMRYNSKHI